ncbi:MAG TPA: FAD-binding oxidoreductase [Candidatus Polarisedimenticolia bacterium]|nr:FAD-binding oxidoreductase [Candidatus Polarisedimenticolia bacterium]
MRKASVVIVGAGIMGASAAWHLAARGWRDILLLDRSPGPGEGSTGKATGGFRAQFETAVNVRLSLLSRAALRSFPEEIGVDSGYRPFGYLWIARHPAQMEALAAARRVQHAEGLHEAAAVTPGDIARINPAVSPEGILGGAFCPTDGFLRARAMLDGYLAAAARLGARVEWGVEVTGFARDAEGRIATVRTVKESIAAGAVVNAAGAWAAETARAAGIDLPVAPLRRQVALTAPTDLLAEEMPMTIFLEDGFHLRVRDGRVLLLRPTPGVPGRPLETTVDDDWVREVAATGVERVPVLRNVPVDRSACWAGLYEMSPDRHAILGRAPGCPNLFLINGSSGHGVMHAPALGLLLAEILSDGRARTIDATPLDPDRFAAATGAKPAGLL